MTPDDRTAATTGEPSSGSLTLTVLTGLASTARVAVLPRITDCAYAVHTRRKKEAA